MIQQILEIEVVSALVTAIEKVEKIQIPLFVNESLDDVFVGDFV